MTQQSREREEDLMFSRRWHRRAGNKRILAARKSDRHQMYIRRRANEKFPDHLKPIAEAFNICEHYEIPYPGSTLMALGGIKRDEQFRHLRVVRSWAHI